MEDIAKYSKEQIDAVIDAVEVFHLESQQREAIREFVSRKDVFVALPTGFGKLHCYAFFLLCSTICMQAKIRQLWYVSFHLLLR